MNPKSLISTLPSFCASFLDCLLSVAVDGAQSAAGVNTPTGLLAGSEKPESLGEEIGIWGGGGATESL